MANSDKCPNCGGTKNVDLGNGKHRCLYCGSTFTVAQPLPQPQPQPAPQPTPQPQQPQVVVVNQQTQNVGNRSGKSNLGKGLSAVGVALVLPLSVAGCCHVTPDSDTVVMGIIGIIIIIIGAIIQISAKNQ